MTRPGQDRITVLFCPDKGKGRISFPGERKSIWFNPRNTKETDAALKVLATRLFTQVRAVAFHL